MFRLASYSPLLSPFGTRECHKIQPCTIRSLPLTEACLRFSRTSLFIQSFSGKGSEAASKCCTTAENYAMQGFQRSLSNLTKTFRKMAIYG